MRLTSLILAAAFVAASGVAMADSMATASPKPMHSSSMSGHMMASPKPKASGSMKNDHMMKSDHSMKSDHMMGSPKPKASSNP